MTRAVVSILVLAFGASPVRADTVEPTPEPMPDVAGTPVSLGKSYALPIIGTDAASFGLFGLGGLFLLGAGLSGDEDGGAAFAGATFIVGGVVGYTIGGPLIHVRRGNLRGAMRSAALRAGLPLAGATIAYMADRQSEESEAPIYGLVAGIGIAMVVDWTLLARLPASTTPFVAPSQDAGMQAGIAGRF